MSLSLDGAAPGVGQTLFACTEDGCDYAKAGSTLIFPGHCLFHPEVELQDAETQTYGKSVCRTDPTFALSNSESFTIRMNAQVEEESISGVLYEVHLPSGVTVTDFNKVNLDEQGDYTEADDCEQGMVVKVLVSSEEDALVQANLEYNGAIFHALGRTNTQLRLHFEQLVV